MTTTEKVAAILRKADLAQVSRPSVAGSVGMSVSTLNKHLAVEGARYSELLDRERMRRCELLLDRYGRKAYAKRITDDVGFSDLNSFYRAFKRWTGKRFSDVRLQQWPPMLAEEKSNGKR